MRRTDTSVRLPYRWAFICPDDKNPPFSNVISVAGRVLNRSAPYELEGFTFHAKAYEGPIALAWRDTQGFTYCPPSNTGTCDTTYTDERGDFKYTWTFPEPVIAGGVIHVIVDGKTFNVTVDSTTRIAVHHIDLSGLGAPAAETPGPAFVFVLAVCVLAAVAARRLLPTRPR
jgi:hypothetical protein